MNKSLRAWVSWGDAVKNRNEIASAGGNIHLFNPRSKTLLRENQEYINKPMLVGKNVGRKGTKRTDTLWFIDVLLQVPTERQWHQKTKTWPILRMEFIENKLASKQNNNIQYYDGLSISQHFIERVIERENITDPDVFSSRMHKIMSPIVKLDTKNIAFDIYQSGCEDVCIAFPDGIYYLKLDSIENEGRMICKTYLPYSKMTQTKSNRFIELVKATKINKKNNSSQKFVLINSQNNSVIYDELVAPYVITGEYVAPNKSVFIDS